MAKLLNEKNLTLKKAMKWKNKVQRMKQNILHRSNLGDLGSDIKTKENAAYTNQMSFVKRVAKNNSKNNGNRHKTHKIFLIVLFSL